jgi:ABC-type uncharacterized transport system permease subunit
MMSLVIFSLPILATCSPSTRATLLISGTALISVCTPIAPALYPVVWVLLAAEPAIVPPVARITICGRRVSLEAKALIASNVIASNALKFIMTHPKIDIK